MIGRQTPPALVLNEAPIPVGRCLICGWYWYGDGVRLVAPDYCRWAVIEYCPWIGCPESSDSDRIDQVNCHPPKTFGS